MSFDPSTTFASFNLARPILDAVHKEGYETPTPVQARTIPVAMTGRDIIACAQTGTGKTASFALPVLHRLHTMKPNKARRGKPLPRALVLSPTRELANQIDDSFSTYGRFTGLNQTVLVGGVRQFHQERALRRGIDTLVATPGRLMDLMNQGIVDLSEVRIFVLDEADRMLDMGFIEPIRKIAAALTTDRQTLLFSATMPDSIKRLADALLNDPYRVAIKPAKQTTDLIDQSVYMVQKKHKSRLITHLLDDREVQRAVVFTRTKFGADKLTDKINAAGVSATAIHGNKAQRQRERALEAFRTGRTRVLVATDVAARGLDVDGITHVFNFDLPNEPETYVHRIGRTGRAGAEGAAISFCDRTERNYLRAIERLTGIRLSTRKGPADLHDHEAASDRPVEKRGERRGDPRSQYRSDRKPARQAYPNNAHADHANTATETEAKPFKKPHKKKLKKAAERNAANATSKTKAKRAAKAAKANARGGTAPYANAQSKAAKKAKPKRKPATGAGAPQAGKPSSPKPNHKRKPRGKGGAGHRGRRPTTASSA